MAVMHKVSIQSKIMILVTVTTLLMISSIVIYNVYTLSASVREAYVSQLKGITTAINAEYEESHSIKYIQQVFDYITSKNPRILRLTLHGSEGRILASTDRDLIGEPVDPEILSYLDQDETIIVRAQNDKDRVPKVRLYTPFKEDGNSIGAIELLMNSKDEDELIGKRTLLITLVGILISLAFLICLVLIIRRLLVKPLMVLRRAATAVRHGASFTAIELNASQEINEVAEAFNGMVQKLEERYQELKQAQASLVQQEKMVALGSLVAGVAHEINTPVGIGITAATFLKQRTEEFISLFNSGALKKSSLEQYLQTSKETAEMMETNLYRASELIRSFKQVAVDRSSEAKRRFDVGHYIEEVMFSLRPSLRKTNLQVSVEYANDVQIFGDPGLLSQIVTNLVLNSIKHAYDPGQEGWLRFDISTDFQTVTIRYSDDGKGMPKEIADRIFDPFFTTKRGEGGSGLGMHIVYNIVTQSLSGTIECVSEPGKGTAFIIHFPLEQEVEHDG